MTERAIRQYCHAVGNYLPCPRKQRQHILQSLRLRLEEYRAEHAEDSVTPAASSAARSRPFFRECTTLLQEKALA